MMKIINKYKEVILYIIFGILTTCVNLGIYYVLRFTVLKSNSVFSLVTTNIISWIICVGFAYITNKKYVFNSKSKISFKEILTFYFYRLFTLIIEIILMIILVNRLEFNDKIIKPIVQIFVIILNYIFSKIIIFKKKEI